MKNNFFMALIFSFKKISKPSEKVKSQGRINRNLFLLSFPTHVSTCSGSKGLSQSRFFTSKYPQKAVTILSAIFVLQNIG